MVDGDNSSAFVVEVAWHGKDLIWDELIAVHSKNTNPKFQIVGIMARLLMCVFTTVIKNSTDVPYKWKKMHLDVMTSIEDPVPHFKNTAA